MGQDRLLGDVRASGAVCPTGGIRATGDVRLAVVGQHLEDGPGQAGSVEPELGKDAVGPALGQVGAGEAEDDHGRLPGDPAGPLHGVDNEHAGAAIADPVLCGHHDLVVRHVVEHVGVGCRDHPWIPDRHVDSLGGEPVGGDRGGFDQLAHGHDAHPAVTPANAAGGHAPAHVRWRRRGARLSLGIESWRALRGRAPPRAWLRPPAPKRGRRASGRGWTGRAPCRASRCDWGRRLRSSRLGRGRTPRVGRGARRRGWPDRRPARRTSSTQPPPDGARPWPCRLPR